MQKNIKDYLHLYLGCPCETKFGKGKSFMKSAMKTRGNLVNMLIKFFSKDQDELAALIDSSA